MTDVLPPLVGSERDAALALSVRNWFLGQMAVEDADIWRALQEAKSDSWPGLMQDNIERGFAYQLILSHRDASWWVERQGMSLSTLVSESLAALHEDAQ